MSTAHRLPFVCVTTCRFAFLFSLPRSTLIVFWASHERFARHNGLLHPSRSAFFLASTCASCVPYPHCPPTALVKSICFLPATTHPHPTTHTHTLKKATVCLRFVFHHRPSVRSACEGWRHECVCRRCERWPMVAHVRSLPHWPARLSALAHLWQSCEAGLANGGFCNRVRHGTAATRYAAAGYLVRARSRLTRLICVSPPPAYHAQFICPPPRTMTLHLRSHLCSCLNLRLSVHSRLAARVHLLYSTCFLLLPVCHRTLWLPRSLA